ncbi:hypothetical protein C7E25_24775, partial [Stenotrophomonas maltophilia]
QFAELGLEDADEATLLASMAEHPRLINRPVVRTAQGHTAVPVRRTGPGRCGRGHAAGLDGRTPAPDQPPRGAH